MTHGSKSRRFQLSRPNADKNGWVRTLIFIYIGLLIFEGALRKWFLKDLATPLLVIRDPLAIAIIWEASFKKLWPVSGYRIVILGLAVVFAAVGMIQLALNSSLSLLVVLFGWRTYFLHLPLIFIAAETLTPDDLDRVGRWCCRLAVPMIVLCYVQFYTGGDSIWNVGAGQGTVQLAFEGDRVRASGTFSFSTGTACFFALVAAFAVGSLANPRATARERRWSYGALIACIAFMPVSGSRLALYMVGLVLICGAGVLLNPRKFSYFVVAGFVLYGLGQSTFFKDAMDSMTARLDSARDFENQDMQWGFLSRVFGGFFAPYYALGEVPMFLGSGLGLGTNAGAALVNSDAFMLGEGEWGRILAECGWILGMCYIGLRVWLTLDLLLRSALAIRYEHNWRPLLFWCAGAWTALQGQLGQPTNLGFFVINMATVMITLRGKPPVIAPPREGVGFRDRERRNAASEA